MENVSVTIAESDVEMLDDVVDDDDQDASNRSAALRDVLDEYRELRDRVDELEGELEHQEANAEDLRRQLQEARAREEDVGEIVEYVEDEKSYRRAGLLTRAKWWLTGMDDDND